jgi:hypothetical protein
LVVLWQKHARRDKRWNYIALEFERYTKHVMATGKLCRQVDNDQGIPNPKRMEQKDGFLDELFKE